MITVQDVQGRPSAVQKARRPRKHVQPGDMCCRHSLSQRAAGQRAAGCLHRGVDAAVVNSNTKTARSISYSSCTESFCPTMSLQPRTAGTARHALLASLSDTLSRVMSVQIHCLQQYLQASDVRSAN